MPVFSELHHLGQRIWLDNLTRGHIRDGRLSGLIAQGGTGITTDMIQQVHTLFEDWIRQRPEDWFCSKRLWAKNTATKQTEVGGRDADIDSYAA